MDTIRFRKIINGVRFTVGAFDHPQSKPVLLEAIDHARRTVMDCKEQGRRMRRGRIRHGHDGVNINGDWWIVPRCRIKFEGMRDNLTNEQWLDALDLIWAMVARSDDLSMLRSMAGEKLRSR